MKDTRDLLYRAWTIIANAHRGNWSEATNEWKKAAEEWRDEFHEYLDKEIGINTSSDTE